MVLYYMNNFIKCEHLSELLKTESDVIKRHLDEHKWFNHIEDDNEAVADFINKFGWLMRELYCEQICPSRYKCDTIKEKLYFNKETNNDNI